MAGLEASARAARAATVSQTIVGSNGSAPETHATYTENLAPGPDKSLAPNPPSEVETTATAPGLFDQAVAAYKEQGTAALNSEYRAAKAAAPEPGTFDIALADFKAQRALAANPRSAGEAEFAPRDNTAEGIPKEPEIQLAQNRGGRGPFNGGLFERLFRRPPPRDPHAASPGNKTPSPSAPTEPSNPVPKTPLESSPTPSPTAPPPASSSSMSEAFARVGKETGPAFDRSSVKWGDAKSVDQLPAYARDIASKISQDNPKSGLPRFLFRLESPQPGITGKISHIYDDLGHAAERQLDMSNYVVEKLYRKGAVTGNKALSELPNLLSKGEVYPNRPRDGGQRRVAVVGPWGNAGDKLVTILELGPSGKSAEIVSIHPMPKKTFETRLQKAGALSIGSSAVLSLDEDDAD